MEQFGIYLQTQREKKGIRLEEIASITKIHLHNLELMEQDRWDLLPPEPFIRGFIVAYAKYVGLDVKETIDHYLNQVGRSQIALHDPTAPSSWDPAERRTPEEAPVMTNEASPADLIENPPTFPMRAILVGSGLVVLAGLVFALISIGKGSGDPAPLALNDPATVTHVNPEDSKEVKNPEPPSLAQQTPVPESQESSSVTAARNEKSAHDAPRETASAKPVQPAPAPATKTEPTPVVTGVANHEMEITANARTWIKVVIDEAPPIEYFLGQGEKTSYQAQQKIKVVLGNSTGSRVVHNGKVVEGTKFQGTIRFYIFPQDARFPQDVVARKAAQIENSSENSDTDPSKN